MSGMCEIWKLLLGLFKKMFRFVGLFRTAKRESTFEILHIELAFSTIKKMCVHNCQRQSKQSFTLLWPRGHIFVIRELKLAKKTPWVTFCVCFIKYFTQKTSYTFLSKIFSRAKKKTMHTIICVQSPEVRVIIVYTVYRWRYLVLGLWWIRLFTISRRNLTAEI